MLRRICSLGRGWRLPLATLLALILLAAADEWFVESAPYHGYYPGNAYWAISSSQFPSNWRRIESSDVYGRLVEEWPRPQNEIELAIRLGAGVRPTPVRWRLWMGSRFVVAQSPEGIGVSTYPGFLLRVLDGLRSTVLGRGPDGIAQWGAYYYSWRDGFLIVSRSREYVISSLGERGANQLRSRSDGNLTFQWFGENEGFMRLLPGDDMPVEGQVRISVADGTTPITLANAWPGNPVFAITVRTGEDVTQISRVLDAAASGLPIWDKLKRGGSVLWRSWNLGTLPANWDAPADQLSLALLNVDVQSDLPLPDLAFVMRGSGARVIQHPMLTLAGGRATVPYEWAGEPGVAVPLLGPALMPCFGQSGRDWIATVNESTMASLAGAMSAGPACPPDVDIAVRLSWERAGKIAESIVEKAGALELIPGVNVSDVQRDVGPKLRALSQLGEAALEGHARGNWVHFSGYLTRTNAGHAQ